MTTPLFRRAAAIVLPVLAATSAAQAPETLARHLRSAAALQRLDGELWGIGPDFKAAFRRGGVEFTPALGRTAATNHPLSMRVTGAGRDRATAFDDHAEPTQRGRAAVFDRGAFVERYDVSATGLEQSFVFDRLPEGSGDLVVRVAITTDLQLVRQGDDGLRFELPGLGGVAIGGVTGIDAHGERVRGTLTYADGRMELGLPAAFCDAAALPLVLDPQIGAVFAVTNSIADYEDPELSAPFGTGSYLCAFTFALSASDQDIRAIRIDANGSVIGSLFAVTTGAGLDHDPTIGFVTLRSAHVIAYERGGDLFARSITAGTVVGNEIAAATGTDNQVEPDLGSETTTSADDAVLVYRNTTQNTIQGVQIQVSSTGALSSFGTVTLATPPVLTAVGRPRISHHGGAAGRFLVVYPRTSQIVGSDTKPQLVLVDRNLVVLDSAPATATTNDEDSPDVDGNGDTWIVTFESEPNEGSGDNDIRAVAVSYDEHQGALVVDSPTTVTAIANVDEIDPVVACYRTGSALLAWRRRAGPASANTEVFMKTIDQLSCTECEPTVLLANTSDIETNLTVAAHPIQDDGGLVLWETSTVSAANGDLNAVAWQAQDGVRVKPFGAQDCGLPLPTLGGCARIGNLNHLIQVHGLDGSTWSTLVLSLNASWLVCGNCRLYADPFDGIVFPSTLGTDGFASTLVPIPPFTSLRGLQFFAQWVVNNQTPSAACSWLQADFSNAIAITVE
ncbi:MAG: hypothetical protein JNK78_10090 [Planctomycetes bacterium]|nr:hypothetical protein [Planctomycetota bacterium]